MATPSLVERLKPDHLDPDELKEQLAEKSGPGPAVDDPKAQERYTFEFRWTDGRGKVWVGQFLNKILTNGERQLAGAMRAHMGRGAARDLDDFTSELNLIVSHLTYSLVERPRWAEKLTELLNPRLLQAIYEEVLAHEATFLGLSPAPGAGEAKR